MILHIEYTKERLLVYSRLLLEHTQNIDMKFNVMRSIFLIVCTTWLLLFISSCEWLEAPENNMFILTCDPSTAYINSAKYNLVLIMGQSNTCAGIGLDSSLDIADSRIKQLGRFADNNLKIIQAIEPLEHHSATEDKIGFGLTFSNLFAQHLLNENDSLIIIPCGYGGSGFINNQWNKGDPLYNDAINRVHFVLNKYPESELKVVLWHQGEKDVGNPNYEFALDSFINNLRTDLGYPEVPFILGGMVPHWVKQDPIKIKQQSIIASTKKRITNVGYADPNLPTIIDKENDNFDPFHYNAEGQREMGNRYFNEFLCLINE